MHLLSHLVSILSAELQKCYRNEIYISALMTKVNETLEFLCNADSPCAIALDKAKMFFLQPRKYKKLQTKLNVCSVFVLKQDNV